MQREATSCPGGAPPPLDPLTVLSPLGTEPRRATRTCWLKSTPAGRRGAARCPAWGERRAGPATKDPAVDVWLKEKELRSKPHGRDPPLSFCVENRC
ncbi:hypothetical protein GN956_G4501 [Arapaima gigas]